MINPMNLNGKRILIYEHDTGLDKAIIGKISELGAVLNTIQASSIDEVEPCIKVLIKDQGPFDGFVFTLTHSDFRPLQFVKPELVNEIILDNFGLFVEAMRVVKKNKGFNERASVVALSSISSIRAMKAKMAFCSAKAALDAAIRCLAVELAEKGIRVNSVQKGVVDVDFEKGHIQDVAAINESAAEKMAPLGVTKAAEVANTVAFLLSDATSTITGTSIVIDGGYLA